MNKISKLNIELKNEKEIYRSKDTKGIKKLHNNEKMFAEGRYNTPLIIKKNIKEDNNHNIPV